MILSRVCVCMTTIRDKLSSIILGQVNFSCPQLPPLSKSAKNVHELQPQDIKVVMAIGDSITAGKKKKKWQMMTTVVIIVANYLVQYLGFGMFGRRGGLREFRVGICQT